MDAGTLCAEGACSAAPKNCKLDGRTGKDMWDHQSEPFATIPEFLDRVRSDVADWSNSEIFPWFRGQPIDKPLLPRVLRGPYPERDLIDDFRLRAPAVGDTPPFSEECEWLFLMQHHGLPTRLLDWTEGALIALYFAVSSAGNPKSPVVWMINPVELNRLAVDKPQLLIAQRGLGRSYVHRVFEDTEQLLVRPAAVRPSNVHRRMAAQRSCFVIFGASKDPLEKQLSDTELERRGYLRKYSFKPDEVKNLESELRMYGISRSTLFPDFEGLADEIAHYNSDPSTR